MLATCLSHGRRSKPSCRISPRSMRREGCRSRTGGLDWPGTAVNWSGASARVGSNALPRGDLGVRRRVPHHSLRCFQRNGVRSQLSRGTPGTGPRGSAAHGGLVLPSFRLELSARDGSRLVRSHFLSAFESVLYDRTSRVGGFEDVLEVRRGKVSTLRSESLPALGVRHTKCTGNKPGENTSTVLMVDVRATMGKSDLALVLVHVRQPVDGNVTRRFELRDQSLYERACCVVEFNSFYGWQRWSPDRCDFFYHKIA